MVGTCDDFQPAPHHRRRETGEIADHAAAERHHHVAALDALGDHGFADALENAEAFRLLALRHDDAHGTYAGFAQRGFRHVEIKLGHRGIGDDGGAHIRPQRGEPLAERRKKPAPDDDVIGALAERHVHGHRLCRSEAARS